MSLFFSESETFDSNSLSMFFFKKWREKKCGESFIVVKSPEDLSSRMVIQEQVKNARTLLKQLGLRRVILYWGMYLLGGGGHRMSKGFLNGDNAYLSEFFATNLDNFLCFYVPGQYWTARGLIFKCMYFSDHRIELMDEWDY